MKHLLVMRHGKSEWNKPGQEDIERPLAPRGREAARTVAQWIKRHDLLPGVALISAARRTQETWQLAEDIMGASASTRNQEALYLAGPGEILHQVAGVADHFETVMVIAHNPGLESLSQLLAGPGSNAAALKSLQRGFPTAGLAVFELAGDSWSELAGDGARLTEFVRPRDLEQGA